MFQNFIVLQNEGEIDFFTVNVLDNDNGEAKNVWSLPSPKTEGEGLWSQGRVQISSDGDKEYQVHLLDYRNSSLPYTRIDILYLNLA